MELKDLSVPKRLNFERKRLKLGQKDFSSFLGMSLKQIGRWENDVVIPADKLGALETLGVDSLFVCTGKRRHIDALILAKAMQDVAATINLSEIDLSTKANVLIASYMSLGEKDLDHF